MHDEAPTDVQAVLALLARHGVDDIIVGMVSAVLQGAPATTFDLDVVYDRAPDNVDRVLAALNELDAFLRIQNGQKLRVDGTHLRSAGHKLLRTRYGRLDLLGAIGDGEGYRELLPQTVMFDIDDLSLRVLRLDKYIALKESLGRPKDLAVLPLLRAVLSESGEGR